MTHSIWQKNTEKLGRNSYTSYVGENDYGLGNDEDEEYEESDNNIADEDYEDDDDDEW